MHIVPKLELKFGRVRTDEDGGLVSAWFFDFKGTSIWDPYCGMSYDECVDPRTYYGITLEQAAQLATLNRIYLPDWIVV